MTSLIFFTDETQVLTATDTLATSPDDKGRPLMFTTKAFIIPHLQLIMCGTGVGGFLGKWFIEVNDRMVVRDIDNLDYHTPKALGYLWQKFRDEYFIPDYLTTTVYHFGFSEMDGKIHNYVYRSVNNFISENILYGIGVKPICHPPENAGFPMIIKSLMDEQRALQQSLPKNERVYIGGKIQVHHLTKAGFSVYILDQFEDFESVQQEIFDNFNTQNN
jgi:hypothetical protein